MLKIWLVKFVKGLGLGMEANRSPSFGGAEIG
jgi:hypothetical protein